MPLYDRWILFAAISLVTLGLLMVASSSIVIAERLYDQPFYYLTRQLIFLSMGFFCALFTLRIDTSFWEKMRPIIADWQRIVVSCCINSRYWANGEWEYALDWCGQLRFASIRGSKAWHNYLYGELFSPS